MRDQGLPVYFQILQGFQVFENGATARLGKFVTRVQKKSEETRHGAWVTSRIDPVTLQCRCQTL